VTLVVQVNGKLRGQIEVSVDADRAAIEQAAQTEPNVQRFYRGQADPQDRGGARQAGQRGVLSVASCAGLFEWNSSDGTVADWVRLPVARPGPVAAGTRGDLRAKPAGHRCAARHL